MDCSKFLEIFNPATVSERIHIIGCGSVGSTIAEHLCRYGLTNFELYDFDIVEPKNIANQMFTHGDIGRPKVEALRDILVDINPEAARGIVLHPEGYTDQDLDGYIFLAVDNIEMRRQICQNEQYNTFIKAVFDVRTGLYDAQHYAAKWSDSAAKKALLATMNFSTEEAKKTAPVSACGVEFGVATTIRLVCDIAVANFFNLLLKQEIHSPILVNPFDFTENSTVIVVK